ncbi:MAG: DUF2911 domain-containing protein [Candidatus Acidiferrum sp.]
MRKTIATVSLLCLGIILVAAACHAQQDKSQRPSPPATATLDLGGGQSVTIDYSSPRAKGRKIFGDVVPYGKVWRAGANEATTFVNTVDVTVGGSSVPAGHYTLFAIPEQTKWTLIISKTTGEWGTNYSGPANDLARIDMKASKLSSPVENFTISFEKTSSGGILNMEWENTRASVPIVKK